MSELAHAAMLVGALGHAACATTGRHERLDVATSVVMLLAMSDMALTRIVPELAWTAVLAVLGIALGTRLRPRRVAHGPTLPHDSRSHALHRALAFIIGAWAFAMTAHSSAAPAPDAGHVHASAAAGGLAFAAAAFAMTAFGGWLVVHELRARAVRRTAEAASTTMMLAAMAVPGVLATLS